MFHGVSKQNMGEKLCDIINKEFDAEVESRLSEARLIQQRIKEARELIHRLRFAVLASYYNDPSILENSECTVAEGDDDIRQPMNRLLAERQWESNALHQQNDLVTNDLPEIPMSFSEDTQFIVSPPDSPIDSLPFTIDSSQNSVNPSVASSQTASPMASTAVTPMMGSPCVRSNHSIDDVQEGYDTVATDSNISRFYVTKRIIVGNTSQYLLSTTKGDPTTHKWMVYVRGPPEDSEISQFISSVWFFLHSSYAPNDLVKVTQTPFHLIRRGWGEFPIRVQLHFVNPSQRPIDIIHNLKLDKTKTGQQTLGAETIVDIELERSSVNDSKFEVKCLPNDDSILNDVMKNHIYTKSNLLAQECKREVDSPIETKFNNSTLCELPSTNQTIENGNIESEGDVISRPTKTGAVYHINIPTIDPDEVVMLDHCYDHCVVVSRKTCYTIRDTLSKPSHVVQQYMHKLVRLLPLVGEKCSVTPFTASSVEEFYKWQVGKQRAAEWMRAKSLQGLLVDHLSSLSGDYVIPSTRDIVYWCRRSGYTPLDVSTGNHCIMCGYCMDKGGSPFHVQCGDEWYSRESVNRAAFNTVSVPYNLYEDLVGIEKKFVEKDVDKQNSDMEVDIIALSPTKPVQPHHDHGCCSDKHLEESKPSNCRPSSVALRWVKYEASEVNVSLQPILMDGVLAHAPTHMIYAATQRFLTQLIQQSLIQSEGYNRTVASSTKDRNVTPTQVYSAISSISEFDFLTNQYFGLSTDS